MSKRKYGVNAATIKRLKHVLKNQALSFCLEKTSVVDQALINLAVEEIASGTYYCMLKNIRLWAVSKKHFCMAGSGHCILAMASKTGNYWRALEFYGLKHSDAGALGFSCSSQMRSLISTTKLSWNDLYVELWKAVVEFFSIP